MEIRRTPETYWNLLLAVSLLSIVAGLLVIGAARLAPSAPSQTERAQIDRASATVAKSKREALLSEIAVSGRLWNQDPESLGSTILDQMSQTVEAHNLQLSGFRTEKTTQVGHLREAPVVALVEGSYPDLLRFVNDLEAPKSKLALSMLQLSASNHAQAHITATLSLIAFLPEERP